LCGHGESGAAAGSLAAGAGHSEAARRLIDRYCLDRKLREALRGSGMHGDEAYKGIALAKALLPRLADASLAGTKPDPAKVVADFEAEEELRALLGFNIFDGVTWFNKERMEEVLGLGALFGTMSRGVREGERAGASVVVEGALDPALSSARCVLTIMKACAEAGYRMDGLKTALAKKSNKKA
ncbi:MAG: hypothetical protein WCL50_17545, partial [Spirochaetota bacterium]